MLKVFVGLFVLALGSLACAAESGMIKMELNGPLVFASQDYLKNTATYVMQTKNQWHVVEFQGVRNQRKLIDKVIALTSPVAGDIPDAKLKKGFERNAGKQKEFFGEPRKLIIKVRKEKFFRFLESLNQRRKLAFNISCGRATNDSCYIEEFSR